MRLPSSAARRRIRIRAGDRRATAPVTTLLNRLPSQVMMRSPTMEQRPLPARRKAPSRSSSSLRCGPSTPTGTSTATPAIPPPSSPPSTSTSSLHLHGFQSPRAAPTPPSRSALVIPRLRALATLLPPIHRASSAHRRALSHGYLPCFCPSPRPPPQGPRSCFFLPPGRLRTPFAGPPGSAGCPVRHSSTTRLTRATSAMVQQRACTQSPCQDPPGSTGRQGGDLPRRPLSAFAMVTLLTVMLSSKCTSMQLPFPKPAAVNS